jgi:CrcB protein
MKGSDILVEVLGVAIGGSLGALSRYGVGVACEFLTTSSFPWAILVVNCVGCFLFGLVAAAMSEVDPAYYWLRVALATGFLGGLTTFSSFGFDTYRLLEASDWTLAFLNVAANMLTGLAAVAAGVWLGRQFVV